MRIGQQTRKLRTFYDIGPLFHVQLSTTTGPLRTNVLVKHICPSFSHYEANSQWNINFPQFWWWSRIRRTHDLCSFCIAALIYIVLHPQLQRLRGPTVWDTFHGSLASHKCNSSCLTSDTVCVASATNEIDALLKNKWSVELNINMVISSQIIF